MIQPSLAAAAFPACQTRLFRWVVRAGLRPAIWSALGLLAVVPAAASDPASVYRRDSEPAAAAESPTTVDSADEAGRAERIVSAALAGLARQPSISARVRQRVRIGGYSMAGGGRYVQSGLGERQRFRFESTLTTDTPAEEGSPRAFFTVEFVEVCDGTYCWTFRQHGENPAELYRVDVGRVRQRVESLTGKRPSEEPAMTPHLGGVQRIFFWLREWFEFDRVQSSQIDGVPIWLVEGRWNKTRLGQLLPEQAERIAAEGGLPASALPEGLPWRVRLSIGKRHLFPFRIEHLAIPGERPVETEQIEPIAVLELYDVRLGDSVDATAFVYDPADGEMVDTTDTHLTLVGPPRP